jgi:hypothetical protein
MGRARIRKINQKQIFSVSASPEIVKRISDIQKRTGLSKSAVVLQMLHFKKGD